MYALFVLLKNYAPVISDCGIKHKEIPEMIPCLQLQSL